MQVSLNTLNFGIKKDVKVFNYSPQQRIEVKKIETNNLHYISRKEFIKDKLFYSLSSLYKAGKWLRSKLTYFHNGKVTKIIRSEAK